MTLGAAPPRGKGELLQALGADPRTATAAVLGAAGDLLRRSASLDLDAAEREAIDAALRAIPADVATAFVAGVDPDGPPAPRGPPADPAVEVALADGDEERDRAARPVLEALAARDRLASCAVALARWESAVVGDPEGSPRAGLEARLAGIDALRGSARALVGLNVERRAEVARLDRDRRADAWWYSARSDCDGLVSGLAGNGPDPAHVASCTECREDLHVSELAVREPARRHVSAAELWRYDLGAITAEERRWIDRHADGCPPCAQALWAYRDGERALADLDGPEPGRAPR